MEHKPDFSSQGQMSRSYVPTFITRTWLRFFRVFVIANPSVVCLSVCRLWANVRSPYSGVETFGNISSAFLP